MRDVVSKHRRRLRLGLAFVAVLAWPGCGDRREPRAIPIAEGKPPVSETAVEGSRLRVLGTAQDGGFPHAACSCSRCDLARRDPAVRRRVAGLALVLPESGEVYLVDATPDIREQLDALRDLAPTPGRVDRAPVDGVLLTHAHLGHYTGLAFFGFEAVHTRELPVYCTGAMAAYLRDNGPWSQLVRLSNIALNEIEAGRRLSLGDVRVTPFRVPHRDEYADTLGFVFEGSRQRVLYIPDTEPWERWDRPPETLLGEVDVALLDGTFYSADELPGREVGSIGHPLIRDSVARFESLVGAGTRIVFTHLNHSNPALEPGSAERAEIERRGFAIAADGDEIPL